MRASVQSSCSVTSRKRGLSLSLKGEVRETKSKEPQIPKNTPPNVIYQKLPPAKIKFIGKPQMRPQIYTPISNSSRGRMAILNQRRFPVEYPQRQFSFTQAVYRPNNNVADYERRKAQEMLRQNLKNELKMLNCSLKQKQKVLQQRQRRSVSKENCNLATPYNKINFQPEQLTKTQNIIISQYKTNSNLEPNNQPLKQLNNYIHQQSMTISIHKPKASPKKSENSQIEVKQLLKIKQEPAQKQIREFSLQNKEQKQNCKKIVINEGTIKEMKKKESRKESEGESYRRSFDMRVFEELENKLDRLIGMTSS